MIRASLLRAVPSLLTGLALSLSCALASAQQGEAAMMKRATDLRDAPADSGRSLAALPAQEPVTRMAGRQGGWIQVQNRGGLTGWVHMFDVGPAGFGGGASTSAPSGGNAITGSLRGLSNMFGGGSGQPPRTATSTIGIRGLEAEDLARAQPNLNAVTQMEQLRQNEASARQFAANAPLVAANVPPLPAPGSGPGRAASPQGGNAGNNQVAP